MGEIGPAAAWIALGGAGWLAYLLGALPFGYLVGLCWGVDVRRRGSKNIGATNVARVAGGKAGVLVYLLDIGKGYLGAGMVSALTFSFTTKEAEALPYYYDWLVLLSAFLPVVGHVYPVFLKFKGGKGVAAAAGVLFFMMPVPLLLCVVSFLVVFAFSKTVSLSSLIASLLMPIFFYLTAKTQLLKLSWGWEATPVELLETNLSFVLGLLVGLTMFIFYHHRSNLKRLKAGEELSFQKKQRADRNSSL